MIHNPRRLLRRIAFFSFAAATVVIVAILARYFPSAPQTTRDVTVPDLIGQIYLPNDPRLPSDRYEVTVEYRTDTEQAAGTVLAQSPTPNAVRRTVQGKQRCPLHLTVSAGTPHLTLPELIGTDATLATLQLQALGLRVIHRQQVTDRFTLGQVLQMTPPAGSTLTPGESVTLTVSTVKTQRTLTVPQLVGAPRELALAALRRAGMRAGQITYAPSDKPRDTVISQFPLGNTLITPACAAATLTLSDGSLYAPDGNAADQELFNEAEPDAAPMPHSSATASHESEQ